MMLMMLLMVMSVMISVSQNRIQSSFLSGEAASCNTDRLPCYFDLNSPTREACFRLRHNQHFLDLAL